MEKTIINYRIFHGLAGLSELEGDWLELLKMCEHHQYLHSYEWHLSYMKTILNDVDSIFYIAAYVNEKIVAIFPFNKSYKKPGGLVKLDLLAFPEHSHITLHDFIIADDFICKAPFVQALCNSLRSEFSIKWDYLLFASVIDGSYAQRQLDYESLPFTIRNTIDESYSIDCTDSYENTTAHLAGNFRRNIARLERKANKQSVLSLEQIYMSTAQSDQYLEEFIDIENDSWKGENNSSIMSDDRFIEYYKELKNSFVTENVCIVNFLRQADACIAAQFSILYNGRLNLLKIGFRNAYSSIGPGNILLSYVLKSCVDNGLASNVNIITSPKWADKWKNRNENVYSYYVFNTSFVGICMYTVVKLKPVISSLSRKVISTLKQIKRQPNA